MTGTLARLGSAGHSGQHGVTALRCRHDDTVLDIHAQDQQLPAAVFAVGMARSFEQA